MKSFRQWLLEANYTNNQLYNMDDNTYKKYINDEVNRVVKAIKRPNSKWEKTIIKNKVYIGGYKLTKYPEVFDDKNSVSVILTNETDKIELIFKIYYLTNERRLFDSKTPKSQYWLDRERYPIEIIGETVFSDIDGKMKTFNRRGISDSFYLINPQINSNTVEKMIKDVIFAQIDKVEKSRSQTKVVGPHPLSRFEFTDKRLSQTKEALNTNGYAPINPPGMGIGYIISLKKHDNFFQKGSSELAAFFGVKEIYYKTFDAD